MGAEARPPCRPDGLSGLIAMDNFILRTSASHPLRIDAVEPAPGWGLIGMSLCPGKTQDDARSGRWARDLDQDLARIREWGAALVISLIEEHEFAALQVESLPARAKALGMGWRHLPIRDRLPPGSRFDAAWPTAGAEILGLLHAGRRVFLHCMGGLGRTGTVAACLLVETGAAPAEAISRVRTARPHAIETALQEWYILNYRPLLSAPGARHD